MEEWKDIPGFAGYYQVNILGEFRSLDRIVKNRWGNKCILKGKSLLIKINSQGYAYVSLSKNKKQRHIKVHRILALLFIPNPENKRTVNHKNGKKEDFAISNLEWATDSENQLHAYKMGLATGLTGKANPNFGKFGLDAPKFGWTGERCSLSKIILDADTGIFYFGTREAGEAKGINHHSLRARLNGSIKNTTLLKYV